MCLNNNRIYRQSFVASSVDTCKEFCARRESCGSMMYNEEGLPNGEGICLICELNQLFDSTKGFDVYKKEHCNPY